jgi:hypothetical protein
MIDQKLIDYVRQSINFGTSREEITKTLIANGVPIIDINQAFFIADSPLPTTPEQEVPVPQQPVVTNPVPVPEASAIPTPSPQPAPQQVVYVESPSIPKMQAKLSMGVIGIGLGAMLLIGIVGGVAYAFFEKIGPFASIPYSEQNFMSGVLAKSLGIKTASYKLSGSFQVEPRDEGAKPFSVLNSNYEQLAEQYKNDSVRAQDLRNILSVLKNVSPEYPEDLSQLKNMKSYGTPIALTDPMGKPYEYQLTENGENFSLASTFETSNAIRAIRSSYRYAATSTVISGQNVMFTKDSYGFVYLSSKPPEPIFVQLQEAAKYLPPELVASYSVGATTDFSSDLAEWKFEVDAHGDFGDLTYKVNAEALKKGKVYYFRINNIPSILGELSSYKGIWVKVDPDSVSSESGYGSFSSLSTQLPKIEEAYKKNRQESLELLRNAAKIADEERLFSFKRTPYAERVEGRQLYRYDLEFRRDSIVNFYKRIVEEVANTQNSGLKTLVVDKGFEEYLQSKEFKEVYDYFNENTSLTVWVDAGGYPVRSEYQVRLVPPDTAVALKDKQAKLILSWDYTNINDAVNIEAPDNARPIQEIIEELSVNSRGGMDAARASGIDASIKANLSSARVQAELYHDANKDSYLGVCDINPVKGVQSMRSFVLTATKGAGLSTINTKLATSGSAKIATCHASTKAYAAEVPLKGGGTYCVDSTGIAKVESIFGIGANGTSCK